jgi:hypothetical protein
MDALWHKILTLALFAFLLLFCTAALADIITVTNTNDADEGSLRAAIGLASGTAGSDTIRFAIPASDPGYDADAGVWVIKPDLPYNIPQDIAIDGRIELPGGGYRPGIEIDGSTFGPSGYTGLNMNKHTALLGLIVNRCAYGIWINSADVTIRGCCIGCNPAGSAARPNQQDGILLANGAAGALIEGNLISGNRGEGIRLFGEATAGVIIRNNRIGTNATGDSSLPNGGSGIVIQTGPHDNLIEGNLISGNFSHGVELFGALNQHNTVLNNRIGTDADGLLALPNKKNGMHIHMGAHDNVVVGNQISGNGFTGIVLLDPGTAANIFRHNLVGTDSTGTIGLPNLQYGVYMYKGASNTFFGPENVVAFNTLGGITVDGADSLGGTIGNTITANSIFANGGEGISLLQTGNSELAPPVVQTITATQITGTATPGLKIEFFADQSGQGKVYLGSTLTDPSGLFALELNTEPWTSIVATATDAAGSTSEFSAPLEAGVGSPSLAAGMPQKFALCQNYPNPFNSVTIISFEMGVPARISLKIYDLVGHEVRRLADGNYDAGSHIIIWDGRNQTGQEVSSGVYLYCLESAGFKEARKALALK